MIKKYFNKTISLFLIFIFIYGLFPSIIFAYDTSMSPDTSISKPLFGDIKGFNKSVFESHFSKADRELNPERWLKEAKNGITQAINAWELIALSIYENPMLLKDAKTQIENWSNEELEKRFSQWLIGRFFSDAAENAVMNLSQMIEKTQTNFSWHLDDNGNILFDTQTGDPMIIRLDDEGREFSSDLLSWRNEAEENIKTANSSFEKNLLKLYPELLAYIPSELRESMGSIISETSVSMNSVIKREFEDIAAREERMFTNRRTRDIWSLRKKSDDESARLFTEKLIAETEEACKKGIDEINVRIEQAVAGTGDLSLLGEEWLNLYKEQFDRGLKAWEEAEERFFIRRIEWEQETFKMFSEGDDIWQDSFKQLENQRQKWELSAKELFNAGENLFINISAEFNKSIEDAKKEFELNMAMRIGEGTTRVKALVDMYLISASAAISTKENILFWQEQYGTFKDLSNPDFLKWITDEMKNLWIEAEVNYNDEAGKVKIEYSIISEIKEIHKIQYVINNEISLTEQIAIAKGINYKYLSKNKFESLVEMYNLYPFYLSYINKAAETRDKILENYAELLGTGILKDILSPDATSEDFCLDEYQIALVRANALVLYWERKTEIAQAVMSYAEELTAGRMTEAESIRAWEEAKNAYNESLVVYEKELKKLNEMGTDIKKQQEILDGLTLKMKTEEDILSQLQNDYSTLTTISLVNRGSFFFIELNNKYNILLDEYKEFYKTGNNAVYNSAINYGMAWSYLEQKENAQNILNKLINGDEDTLSITEMEEQGLEIDLLRLAAIKLFSDDFSGQLRANDSDFSGADWYAEAKGITLSDNEKSALYGENLLARLVADYKESSKLLLEQRLDFELTLLFDFIQFNKETNIDSESTPVNLSSAYHDLIENCIVDTENAEYVFEILKKLKERIVQGESYYIGDFDDNSIINYFVSGFSFFVDSELYLSQYFNENNLSLGLLDLYSEYASFSSFNHNEIWKDSNNALTLLLDNYKVTPSSSFLPDIYAISTAIMNKPGDFIQNTAQFLIELDNCFPMIPQWLEKEINNWKTALIEFVNVYAHYNNVQSDYDTNIIYQEYASLQTQYNTLMYYSSLLNFIDENEAEIINSKFKDLLNNKASIEYLLKITKEWENLKTNEILSDNELHWRQYLTSENIEKNNALVASASTWLEGIFEDAIYKANYFSNRMNDSFNLFSQSNEYYNNQYNINGNAELYYNLYTNALNTVDFRFNSIKYLYNNIANAARSYEISKLNSDDAADVLETCKLELDEQQEKYNNIKNTYFLEVENFITIGSLYDNQYSILKSSHETSNEKRFEYEKQDAINRWASTAYLNTDTIDLANNKEKLARAKTVLDVLSNLYNDESSRSFENPEYAALYSAYEQSFNRTLLLNEVINALSSTAADEFMNNDRLYSEYQKSLYQLGYVDQNYLNYTSNIDSSLWNIKDIITVKNERLVFSRDNSMKLSGIDTSKANDLMNFFNTKNSQSGEYNKISLFEESLRNLSERMTRYFSNTEKLKQWSLAKDYLITSLIDANKDLVFLQGFFIGQWQMQENGAIASLYTKADVFEKNKTLYSVLNGDSLIADSKEIFSKAWRSLSAEEKADLEYYVILTLSGYGNDYLDGFSKMYTLDVYNLAYDYTNKQLNEAKSKSGKWYNFAWQWAWNEMKDVNKNTLNKIIEPLEAIRNEVNEWINGINENLSLIKKNQSAYLESCKNLDFIEGIDPEKPYITWEDINDSLLNTNKISIKNINELKSYWDLMHTDSNYKFESVTRALTSMLRWSKEAESNSKTSLEKFWNENLYKQNLNENNFLTLVNGYIDGSVKIKELKEAADNAYGKKTSSWKNHYNNMYSVLYNNLSAYLDADINMTSDFYSIGNELVFLAEETLERKYKEELKAREIEWQQIIKDITDKYNEWQTSAAQILEKGRMDWALGLQKMKDSYQEWNRNFQSEYERINIEWDEAYLAGLDDKERWLEQVADAANRASTESFLSLIGTEGERLSRFIDTREPFGIRGAVPETENLMAELLKSSGIVNMSNAFSSLNNISSSISTNVKRGMKGTTWDANLIKTAAADLARQTNAEIANNETKILAYNARLNAEEIVKNLSVMVDGANKNFRENMDNHFIFNGLWKKNGNNYVKDIIKGSTLFTPVVTETVYISSYVNYLLEPVTLQTNLDENLLASLDTLAIRGLLDNVILEVKTISEDIFGKENEESIIKLSNKGDERIQSPGKFGVHIGYSPDQKPPTEMGKNKDDMFYDKGEGEIGRLMSEFIYWQVIESRGSSELSLAPWDKRMWNDDGSWFTAPSLRTVGTIAGSIAAGIISGGSGFAMLALSIGVGTASDLAFGTLDAAMGYKGLDEVAFNVGKSLLTNTVTSVAGGLFNGITKTAVNAASGSINKVITQTMMTGVQSFTTGFVTNLISGVTYDSTNGFGYSSEIVRAGFNNMLTNTLVSMTGSLVSSSLHAINTGNNICKLLGFNEINQTDVSNLNNLAGSLAGQGVNYALGNDFSLNVLNLNLLSGGKYQSGLLELNIGRNGVKMNLGTGGANVSIDNLESVFRGAMVWNTNNRISSFVNNKDNNFDAAVALRAQYGYGDTVQKGQLWDILKGDVKIITDTEGDFYAESNRDKNGNKVIKLTGYKQGMSDEDQFRLAAIFGHEAYRDGYGVGETDAFGNTVTSTSNFNELKTASIARLAMTDRISAEHEWFYQYNQDFYLENAFLLYANETGDYSMYDEYLEYTYKNDKDYFWISTTTGNNFQNDNRYSNIPLFDALSQERVNEINEERKREAFGRYELDKLEKEEEVKTWEDFINDKNLLSKYNYIEKDFISLYKYGCRFMTVKYSLEALTGGNFNTQQLHNFIKNNNLYTPGSELSNENMAEIITKKSNGYFNVTSVFSGKLTLEQINEFAQSENMYLACIQVPNGYGGEHFVMYSGIEDIYNPATNSFETNIKVANPWDGNADVDLVRKSYSLDKILRWDVFLVTPTSRINYNLNNNLLQRQSTVSTVSTVSRGEYSYQTLMNGIKR